MMVSYPCTWFGHYDNINIITFNFKRLLNNHNKQRYTILTQQSAILVYDTIKYDSIVSSKSGDTISLDSSQS